MKMTAVKLRKPRHHSYVFSFFLELVNCIIYVFNKEQCLEILLLSEKKAPMKLTKGQLCERH